MPDTSPFQWTAAATIAARLVAERNLSEPAVVERIKTECTEVERESRRKSRSARIRATANDTIEIVMSVNTLRRMKEHPDFAARVEEHRQAFHETVMASGIGNLKERIRGYHDRRNRMLQIIEARASDASMAQVPGGSTGLIVRSIKMIGAGSQAKPVVEYKIDDGLLCELRAHEQQAAKELGQWTEKAKVEHDFSKLSDAELIKIATGGAGGDGAAADEAPAGDAENS